MSADWLLPCELAEQIRAMPKVYPTFAAPLPLQDTSGRNWDDEDRVAPARPPSADWCVPREAAEERVSIINIFTSCGVAGESDR